MKKVILGVDIRNIGKQRTGDEVVFLNLVKNYINLTRDNSQFKNWYFKLFTDISDKLILKQIAQRLEFENNSRFQIIPLKATNKFIWNAWVLPRYLHQNPVDIYHTQYITPFFISREIKIVTHIHDISFEVFPQFIKKIDLFFLKVLIPFSIRRADKIIAVSNFTRKEIEKYYPLSKGKILVVYNASDFSNLKANQLENENKKIKEKYNLPNKYILYIGTLQPRKNILTLIKAYLKIKNKLNDVNLVIAGNFKTYNVDKRLYYYINYKSSKIHFIGYVNENDKLNLIKNAFMFIYPSLYEGFGIPLLEAMSVQIPVIASNILSHREVGADAVVYFNPSNVDELAKKIYNVYIDKKLREKLKKEGLKRVNYFSWRKSAEKMLDIYRVLVDKNNFLNKL